MDPTLFSLCSPTPPFFPSAPPPPPSLQWINCDIRTFDMSILGKFGVIMADPPWEIHQVRLTSPTPLIPTPSPPSLPLSPLCGKAHLCAYPLTAPLSHP